MLRNINNSFYQSITKVLRKMDEVLNRKGIPQFQDRIVKIVNFLIKLERDSINCVSNFSANNQEIKKQIDLNLGKKVFNKAYCLYNLLYDFLLIS